MECSPGIPGNALDSIFFVAEQNDTAPTNNCTATTATKEQEGLNGAIRNLCRKNNNEAEADNNNNNSLVVKFRHRDGRKVLQLRMSLTLLKCQHRENNNNNETSSANQSRSLSKNARQEGRRRRRRLLKKKKKKSPDQSHASESSSSSSHDHQIYHHDLEQIIEAARVPHWVVDMDDRITVWNPEMAALLGMGVGTPPADAATTTLVLRQTMDQVFFPGTVSQRQPGGDRRGAAAAAAVQLDASSLARFRAALANAKRGHPTFDFELEFQIITDNNNNNCNSNNDNSKIRDTKYFLVHTTPRRDVRNQIVGVFCVVAQDVAEAVRRDHAVAGMAGELRQVIDTAKAPIFGIDVDGNVNEWNRRAHEIT